LTLSEQRARDHLLASWRTAQLAEVGWLSTAGVPDATAVVPLLDDGIPCLALTYAQLELARALDRADGVVIGVTTPAVARGAEPVLARVHVEVTADPEGIELESRGLLPQLIAKHPPDRRRLDSLLQRREHWWYVPRLLVRLTGAEQIRRVEPRDGLLLTGGDDLEVTTCGIESIDPLVLGTDACSTGDDARAADVGTTAADGAARDTSTSADRERPALVLRHGADVPELEQPWEQRWRGVLGPRGFEVDGRHGDGPPSRALTLRQRVAAEWRLERACKRGLKAAGHER
jgi:hypothetical protein